MKYTVPIEIALPRQRVIELLEDPSQRPKWLRGLVSHEAVHGVDGQVGTESRVIIEAGKQTMECTETIMRREPANLHDVPSETVIHFEREVVADGMWSASREYLAESGPQCTLWVSESDYRFPGLMQWVAPLMRGSFIKQSRRQMEDFKAFAQRGTDVRQAKA